MKEDIARRWIADLRTNPPQTRGCLFDGTGYCCLGRLELLMGSEFGTEPSDRTAAEKAYPVLGSDGVRGYTAGLSVLTESTRLQAGLRSATGDLDDSTALANMNDRGVTFPEIADFIEKHWESL